MLLPVSSSALRGLAAIAVVAAAPPAAAQDAAADTARTTGRLDVEAPRLLLTRIGFSLRLTAPAGAEAAEAIVLTAGGRELARAIVGPGAPGVLEDLEISGGAETPLRIRWAGSEQAVDAPVLPGWSSLLPPLAAIGLALIFKEVVVSLFCGVWLGAFLFAGLNPVAAFLRTLDRFVVPSLADVDHASIIVFSLLLGGMVGVMARSGGTQGIVDAVSPLATSPRRAQLATYLGGLAIFFDDYANTLIVGNTMRPLTDRLRVSREKLAYIVDSTAAPVAAIIFVSTWVGFEISLIGDGLRAAAAQPGVDPATAAELVGANPFTVFLHSIPYLFYPILALLMVALIITTQRDFGPMWSAENRASRGEGLYREDAQLMVDTSGGAMEPKEGAPRRWINAAAPVVTVITVVLAGLFLQGRARLGDGGTVWDVFGAANPYQALLWGSFSGCVVAIGLAAGQRILKVEESIEALLGGMRAMLLAMIILILAWSLGEVTEVLGTAAYLTHLLEGNILPQLMPVLVFVTAAAIAFATGTSWATMAILIPLVIPLMVALGGGVGIGGSGYSLLLGTISSVLAGAIWGDHCSPISDTTVLSSMASACDHVDHVRTQLPYALTVGVVGMAAGDIPTAFGMSPVFSYLIGGTVLFLILRFLGRYDHDSPQWEGVEGPPGAEEAPAV